MLKLSLDPKTENFRADFSKWLAANPPPTFPARVEIEQFVEISREWQRKLATERWIGVHWPEQFGGRGLGIVQEAVVQELLAEANSPQLVGMFGLTMVGPVLIKHGTGEQKTRFLKRILAAEEIWCQGFSEPQAGSDLAAVRTAGTKIKINGGEGWEITGQKIWTSFAQFAEWCFMLVRTDTSVPKHKGLSYILVPMKSAGIDVRPLTQISGEKEFNELFLYKVQVPAENMVGKPGDGWEIAISTLMYERVILTFQRHLQSEEVLSKIATVLRGQKVKDRHFVEEFGRLTAKSMAVRALALSHLVEYDKGNQPGPEGSLDKLGWSETFQEICKLGMKILGPEGVLDDGFFPFQYLYSRGRTIAAGTSEIQRGIIAERVLGLPRK